MTCIVASDTYCVRATRAFLRTGGIHQPSRDSSGGERVDGKDYVVLRNVNGLLAVYRVKGDGTLRRLRRWPKGLN